MSTYLALIACLVVGSLGCAAAAPPLIIAHRGASHDAPENTLAAFKLAWEQGADAIEGDFYLTRDGRIVCIHDADTQRTAGVQRVVAQSTFEELRALDVGAWKDPKWAGQRIPTIEEVLPLVPQGKRIYLEIKCGSEIVPALKDALARSNLKPAQVRLISFKEDVILECRRQLPAFKTYWLVSFKKDAATGQSRPTADAVMEALARTKADGLGCQDHPTLDAALVQRVHKLGLEFNAWTIDDPKAALRAAKLGVDWITTNRPAFLREEFRRASQ